MAIPVLIKNQGLATSSLLTVNIESNTKKVELLEIFTEAMKVDAIFGNTENISPKLKDIVAHQSIHEAYARIGKSGTYIQFHGNFPSKVVEIFVIKLRAEKPIDIDVTIRIHTPLRIRQHRAVDQKLTIT